MKTRLHLTLLCVGLLTGCHFVSGVYIPEPVSNTSISYDQGEQNSGIVGELPDGTGFIVTQGFVERYAALVDLYGSRFTPKLEEGEGLTKQADGKFGIDNEHMVKFLVMNKWRKSGMSP